MPFAFFKYLRRKRRKKKGETDGDGDSQDGARGPEALDGDAAAAAGDDAIDERNSCSPYPGMVLPRVDGPALASPLALRHGEPAVLKVLASGIPAPSVKWLLGSKEIKDGRDFRIKDDGAQHTLIITRVGDDLGKRGICVLARNRAGEVRRELDVQIYKDSMIRSKRTKVRLRGDGRSMSSLDTLSMASSMTSSQYDSVYHRMDYPKHNGASNDNVFDTPETYHSAEGLLESPKKYTENIRYIAGQNKAAPASLDESRKDAWVNSGSSVSMNQNPKSRSVSVPFPPADPVQPVKSKLWESPRSTDNLDMEVDAMYHTMPSRGKSSSGYNTTKGIPAEPAHWYKPTGRANTEISPEHSVSSPNVSTPVHEVHPTVVKDGYPNGLVGARNFSRYSEPQLMMTQADIVGHAALGSLPNTLVPRGPWPSILKNSGKTGKRWEQLTGKPPPKPQRVSWTRSSKRRRSIDGQSPAHSSGLLANPGFTPSTFVSRNDSGERRYRSSQQGELQVEVHSAPSLAMATPNQPRKTDLEYSYISEPIDTPPDILAVMKANRQYGSGGGSQRQDRAGPRSYSDPPYPSTNKNNQEYMNGPEIPSEYNRRKKRVSFSESNLLIAPEADEGGDNDNVILDDGHTPLAQEQPTSISPLANVVEKSTSDDNANYLNGKSMDKTKAKPRPQRISGIFGETGLIGAALGRAKEKILRRKSAPARPAEDDGKSSIVENGPHGLGSLLGKTSDQHAIPVVEQTQGQSTLLTENTHGDLSKKEIVLLRRASLERSGDGLALMHGEDTHDNRTSDTLSDNNVTTGRTEHVATTENQQPLQETGTLTELELLQFMTGSDDTLDDTRPRHKTSNIRETILKDPLIIETKKPDLLTTSRDISNSLLPNTETILSDTSNDDKHSVKSNIKDNETTIKSKPLVKTEQLTTSIGALPAKDSPKTTVNSPFDTMKHVDKRPRVDSIEYNEIVLVQTETFLIADTTKYNPPISEFSEGSNISDHFKSVELERKTSTPETQSKVPLMECKELQPKHTDSVNTRTPSPELPIVDLIKINGKCSELDSSHETDETITNGEEDEGIPGVIYISDTNSNDSFDEESQLAHWKMDVMVKSQVVAADDGEIDLQPVSPEKGKLEAYVDSVMDHVYDDAQHEYAMEDDIGRECRIKQSMIEAFVVMCKEKEGEATGNSQMADSFESGYGSLNGAEANQAALNNNAVPPVKYDNTLAKEMSALDKVPSDKPALEPHSKQSNGSNNGNKRRVRFRSYDEEYDDGDEEDIDDVVLANLEFNIPSSRPKATSDLSTIILDKASPNAKWQQIVCEQDDNPFVSIPNGTPPYNTGVQYRDVPVNRGSYQSSQLEDPFAEDVLSDISEGDECDEAESARRASPITWEDLSDTDDAYGIDDASRNQVNSDTPAGATGKNTPHPTESAPRVGTKIVDRPLQIFPVTNSSNDTTDDQLKDSELMSGDQDLLENDIEADTCTVQDMPINHTSIKPLYTDDTHLEPHHVGDSLNEHHSDIDSEDTYPTNSVPYISSDVGYPSCSFDESEGEGDGSHIAAGNTCSHRTDEYDPFESHEISVLQDDNAGDSSQLSEEEGRRLVDDLQDATADEILARTGTTPSGDGVHATASPPEEDVHVVSRLDSLLLEIKRHKGSILVLLLAMVFLQMLAMYACLDTEEDLPLS